MGAGHVKERFGAKDSQGNLSDEEYAFLLGGEEEEEQSGPTDSEQRAALRDAGLDIGYTKGDILEELYKTLTARNPYAEEAGPIGTGGDKFAEFERNRQDVLNVLRGAYEGDGDGPTGRVFRPQTIEQPSQKNLLSAAQEATLGPDPSSLFRTVFQEAFPDLTQGQGPFEKFVQGQEKELQSRFEQQVFKEFTTPGKVEQLRGDYENLLRQQEKGSFSGAGGSVPNFNDFVKGRFQSNYMQFLAGEKPKLQQAFELTSPQERGQRNQGQIAPQVRFV